MTDAEELFRRAYACQMAGELGKAIEYYRRSIEIRPSAEAHTFLGWTYSFQGRYDLAIEECRRAIEVDPDFGNPYNDIGVYLIELGRMVEAIPWLQKAVEAPRYDPRHFPHFNLARVYVQQWDYDRALRHLECALEAEPEYPAAKRELARLLAQLN